MNTLWLDLETYCATPIAHGTHAYAINAEILLLAFAQNDGPVEVEDFPSPARIQALIDWADEVVIHNSAFDRTVLSYAQVRLPTEKIHDTMVQALLHSLPGALGNLCDILQVPKDLAKEKDGKRLIHLFCKPLGKNRKLDRATKETHPADWEAFRQYAGLDIEAMRQVYKRLPRWNWTAAERHLWSLDQSINDRGIAVDTDLAREALRAAQEVKAALAVEANEQTGGAVPSTTQTAVTLAYLRDVLHVDLEDLKGGTIERALKGDLPEDARELLEMRATAAAASPAKYSALLKGVSPDGRLRGTLQFAGASRSGRWGGRIFQPQNLPRPTLKAKVIEQGIRALKLGVEADLFADPMELCVSAIRGTLVAAPGHKLVIADLSNIEGRVLAWLADEEWKLEAFREFDQGKGFDIYIQTAAGILNKRPEDVTKGERQVHGKVPELACLGPDTRVLTHVGPVAIVDVTQEHLLWDGEAWTTHGGLIARGERQTIQVMGVESTPDHLFLRGSDWVQAREVNSCPITSARVQATGLESLRSLALSSGLRAASGQWKSAAAAARGLTPCMYLISAKGPAPAATLAPESQAPNGSRTGSVMRPSAPTRSIAAGSATAYLPATTAATIPGTPVTPTTGAEASRSTSHGGKTGLHSWLTSYLSRGGTCLPSSLTGRTSTEATSPETCASSAGAKTETTCELCRDCSGEWTSLRPVYDIADAGPRNRFTILTDTGAAIVHNCGYQGSVGAFAVMGANYGVQLPEETVLAIVRAWRAKHPNTVNLWYGAERAAVRAVKSPGEVFRAGKLAFHRQGAWLRMRLPSGRYLTYVAPQVDGEGKLSYEGVHQYTRKWTRLKTYGGKLVENATQAVARDILAAGLVGAEEAGYAPVLHVHDEILCETPDDASWTVKTLSDIMSQGTQWSVGLPLAAAGFETHRYRKED